jgi:hypothetical protein
MLKDRKTSMISDRHPLHASTRALIAPDKFTRFAHVRATREAAGAVAFEMASALPIPGK